MIALDLLEHGKHVRVKITGKRCCTFAFDFPNVLPMYKVLLIAHV